MRPSTPIRLHLAGHLAATTGPWTEPLLLLERTDHTELLASTDDLDAAARWALAHAAVPISPPALRCRMAEISLQMWIACVSLHDLTRRS